MENAQKDTPVVFPRRLIYLSTVVSVICISLIILHAIFPKAPVDTTTVALLVILIFPWLLPYVKTIKLPGGTEIDFKDDVQKLESLSQKSSGIPSKPMRVLTSRLTPSPSSPSRLELLQTDPNLALASLRIEVETKLREIAAKKKLSVTDERTPLRQVLYALHSQKTIRSPEFDMLNIIIDACNRAVHAEKIDTATASEIVSIGESAILYLDSKNKES